MPRNQPWPDSTRTAALERYAAEGLPAAHHATGVPKPTIVRWANAAGITAPTKHSTAQQTANAHEARRRALADARDRRVTLLAVATELALQRTVDHLRNDDLDDLALRDLVGVWTRGHHDLALDEGRATSNMAVSVTLNVPAASSSPPAVVAEADLPALPL